VRTHDEYAIQVEMTGTFPCSGGKYIKGGFRLAGRAFWRIGDRTSIPDRIESRMRSAL
jgi:hypothetical protein